MHEDDARALREAVIGAFFETHKGRSTDDVIVYEDLNREFIAAALRRVPGIKPFQLNWTLYNIRKSGKLGPVTKVRVVLRDREEYIHAVEIAARYMEDRYELTIDQLVCDPRYLPEFDKLASEIAPGHPSHAYRKAALGLRKGRKLQPELAKKFVEKIASLHHAHDLLSNLERIPHLPGVYVFADKSGSLYIGETAGLRFRIAKHLDHSDNKSLAHYLWDHGVRDILVQWIAFERGSRGERADFRRALEATLIASRKPRFNIAYSVRSGSV